MDPKAIKKLVDAGKKALKQIGINDADNLSDDQVVKVMKNLNSEAKSAPDNLLSANKKNMDALSRAKKDIPADTKPAYKNVNETPDHRLVGKPTTKEAVLVPEGTGVPAVRKSTIPSVVETTAKRVDDNMLPMVRENTLPANIVDDIAEKSGMSLKKKAAIGTGLVAGVGGGVMLADKMNESDAGVPLLTQLAVAAAPAVVNAVAGGSDKPAQNRAPSDEVSSEAAKPKQENTEAPAQSDYVKELLAAQKSENELDLVDNMLRAGSTIGHSLATPDKKLDLSAVDSLQAQNGKGVANVKQKMKTEAEGNELRDAKILRDPQSDVSKAFRAALAKLGIPHSDKTTAADAKAMGINIQNLLMQEKTIAAQSAKADRDAGKRTNSFITGAQKHLLKPFGEYQKVATAKKALDGYLKGEANGPKDVAILYDFIRGLDPSSSVKEGEVTLGKSAMSLFEQYGINAKKLTSGQILSPEFRKAVAGILQDKEKLAREQYEQVRQPILLQAADYGLGEDDYSKLDYLSAADGLAKQAGQVDPNVGTPQEQMVTVTEIATGRSKVMPASKAAKANPAKYTVSK